MADSTWASGLQVSRWGKQLFYEAGYEIYWKKFMSDGKGSPIQVKHELDGSLKKGGKGKDVTFGLLENLDPTRSVSGDDTLEGNEESMTTYSQTVTTQMERNAVRDTGRFDNSKVLYEFRKEALADLKTWLAEFIDYTIFTALLASPTRTLIATGASLALTSRISAAKASLDGTGALIAPADISVLRKLAKVPAASAEKRIRPIKVDGRNYYVLIIHPEQAYDLKRNSEWQQAQREANVRGESNPIFSGALGVWDDVVGYA